MGLLDALDYFGQAIDKPGRAVRGLLSGNAREGLAAVPFSDSLGLTDQSQATSGEDLLGHYGLKTGNDVMDAILGFGANAATDPLTYAGGFLGRAGGRMLGRGLEGAAAARGPGYATTAEQLAAQLGGSRGGKALAETWQSAAPDAFAAAAREVPAGSSFLNAGVEGMAFKTPAGDVVRLGQVAPGTAGRPVAASVLQPLRTAEYPAGEIALRAERLPFAEGVGAAKTVDRSPAAVALRQRAAAEGLDFNDVIPANWGRVGGNPVVIDPGAVTPMPMAALRFNDVTQAAQPNRLTRLFLDALGGRPAMQRALDSGLAHPQYQQLLGRLGLAGGASLGLT